MEVEAYLLEQHVSSISWHFVLNNHASTRPEQLGGPIVKSVTACKDFSAPSSASANWQCILDLPHSFANGDGRRVVVHGEGKTKEDASEAACLHAVASLISANPSEFLLRPKHWKVTPDTLLENLPGADAVHQALPVPVPARLRDAGADAAIPDADARVADLVRQCLHAHGGEFDPAKISHKKMGLEPGDEPVYSMLNKLLVPGSLKAFVAKHPEFSWKPNGTKGMTISWAGQESSVPRAPEATTGELGVSFYTKGATSSNEATGGGAGNRMQASPAPSSASPLELCEMD